jgi:hypothetical protein
MNQAIHIFRKDVRHLWPAVSVALAIQVLFTTFEMQPHRDQFITPASHSAETLVDFLLPLAWWYLIVALVHEEPLPGDRQFWVTRPYSWKSLLTAKVLFIFAFINLPVLIADCFILTAQSFSIVEHWEGLLWRQVPFTVSILVPPLALASLTRNLGQVIVAILLVILRIVVNSIPFENAFPRGSTGMEWIQATADDAVLLFVLSAVILIQYRSRRTWLARTLTVAFVILPGFSIPLRWQLDWQARVKAPGIDVSGIKILFDASRGRRKPLARTRGVKTVNLAFPVEVKGAPNGVDLVSGGAKVVIRESARTVWSSDFAGAALERDKAGYWETMVIPANIFAAVRNQPVTIRMRPVLKAARCTEFRAPLEVGGTVIPGVGICESRQWRSQVLSVQCRSALAPARRTRVHADYPGWDDPDPDGRPREQITGELSDPPFPAGLSLSPVHTWPVFSLAGNDLAAAKNYPDTHLVFEVEHPAAHFQTEIEMKEVQLEKYAVFAPQE